MKRIKTFKMFENASDLDWKEEFKSWCSDKKGPWHYSLEDFKTELEEKGLWREEWNKEYADYWNQLQEEYFTTQGH